MPFEIDFRIAALVTELNRLFSNARLEFTDNGYVMLLPDNVKIPITGIGDIVNLSAEHEAILTAVGIQVLRLPTNKLIDLIFPEGHTFTLIAYQQKITIGMKETE